MITSLTLEMASPKFKPLLQPKRYKVLYGGRGSGKSHFVARVLLLRALTEKIRILCCREFQRTIKDSVHKLLSDLIVTLGLSSYFTVTQNSIISSTGSEFIFAGLHSNASEIKSMEGIDVCYIEEAQSVSEQSYDFLIPTIRKPHSEIWICFNPDSVNDPSWKRFVSEADPDRTITCFVNWNDNKFFNEELRAEKDWCAKTDYDRYLWIWEGNPRNISDAVVYKDKFVVEDFETPASQDVFEFGLDFGFSHDPTALIRAWERDRRLYVDYESGGVGVEFDEMPALFRAVPLSDKYKIIADNSRPETISYLRNKNYDVIACNKYAGSVEDGIANLKNFEKIIVHPRCKRLIEEFKLYSYKRDPQDETRILPVLIDKNNHYLDALRYAEEFRMSKMKWDLYW